MKHIATYINYWYAHSGDTARDWSDAKRTSLLNQMRNYRKAHNQIIVNNNQQVNEIQRYLAQTLRGQAVDTRLANQIMQNPLDMNSGLGDMTFGEVLGGNVDISGILASELLSELYTVQNTTQRALSVFISVLGQQYSNAVTYAIAQYTNSSQNISSSELLSIALSGTSNGVINIPSNFNFSNAEQELIRAYSTIQTAIDAIPAFNEYSSNNDNNLGQLAINIVGKIGGAFNKLSQLLGRVAMAKASEVMEKRAGQLLTRASNSIYSNAVQGPNISVRTSVVQDNDLIALANKKTTVINTAIGESKLVVNDSVVSLTFGGNIQPLSIQKFRLFGGGSKLTLTTNASLGQIFATARNKNHDLSLRYINQLAAGHEFVEQNLGTNYHGTVSLQQAWKSLVDYAVVLNFADFLTKNANNENLYLLNNKIWDIAYILQEVANNPDAIEYTGGKQRHQFWSGINKWQYGSSNVMRYNKTLGLARSSDVQARLSEAFSSTIIKVKLNISLLNLM